MVRAATGDDRLEAIEQSRQIRAPDVPPVDDAKRKDQPSRSPRQNVVKLPRCADEIDVKTRDRKRKRRIEIVTEAAEIGRQHDLQLRQRMSEGRVSLAKRVASRIFEIEHEAGLVELNPLGAISGKPSQHIDIDGDQFAEQR